MATFRQHIPSFIDIDGPPPLAEFSTTEDLLSLEIVQSYGKSKDFSHFAMYRDCLMEIRDSGFKWLVVGYVSDPSVIDLPKWEGGKFRAELPDGSRAVLGSEVVSSYGDVLILRDGTKARNLWA